MSAYIVTDKTITAICEGLRKHPLEHPISAGRKERKGYMTIKELRDEYPSVPIYCYDKEGKPLTGEWFYPRGKVLSYAHRVWFRVDDEGQEYADESVSADIDPR